MVLFLVLKYKLFIVQTFYGIGVSSFDGLETNGKQGNGDCYPRSV